MKTNNMMNRIKKTSVGKVLCRLVGEDTGAVMMEYVIIAVLIAAACAAAIAYFGHTTAETAGVAERAMTGDVSGAQQNQKDAQQNAEANAKKGVDKAKEFSNL